MFQVALAHALPQPFHFVASLGFFQVPASAVPWRCWECFVVCVCVFFYPAAKRDRWNLCFYPFEQISKAYFCVLVFCMNMLLCVGGDGTCSCVCHFVGFKLPPAFKGCVLNYYGGEWLPRTTRWIQLSAGALLRHGAAFCRVPCANRVAGAVSGRSAPTRAGMARQHKFLRVHVA